MSACGGQFASWLFLDEQAIVRAVGPGRVFVAQTVCSVAAPVVSVAAIVFAVVGVGRFVCRPAERFELFDAFDGERGDALALGFEALDADVTLGVDVKRIAKILGAAISDAQAGVGLVGEQDKARGRVVADEARVTVARRTFESEPLDIGEALLVGVEEDGSPDRVRRELSMRRMLGSK